MKLAPFGMMAPGGDPPVPLESYAAAAIDGFTNGPGGPTWSTSTGDPETGNVTSWPSINGTLGPIVPLAVRAVQASTVQGPYRTVSATANLRLPVAAPATPGAMLMTIKPYGANTYVRITGRVGGGTTGLFLWPVGTQFDLEKQTATTSRRWIDPGNSLGLNADRNQWQSVALLFASTPTAPRLFLNGAEVPESGGFSTITPATMYDGIGQTGAFADFYVGDWLFYDNPTPADLIAYTAAAKALWDV